MTARGVAGAARRSVRDHWFFVLLLSAGLALRVLAQAAYRPALLYIDSAKYLVGSGGTAPEGYQALLRLLDPIGGLALVAAVQHAFGLAMAVRLYALVLRLGGPRWAAALAAAPVLLDAYQLQLEQTIMPDVLFETMIAAGLALLLWPGRPGLAAGALVLGATATVREIGGVLVVPAVVFAALTAPRWRRTVVAAACFVLPVLGYMTELGDRAEELHEEAGRQAAQAGLAGLIVVGDDAAPILAGAKAEPSWRGELLQVPDVEAAVTAVGRLARPGDVVLVKASRAANLQRVALALTGELDRPPGAAP